jgi:hypothetical protein
LRELRRWSEEKLEELRLAGARMEQLDQENQQLHRLAEEKTEELRLAAERISDLDADFNEAKTKLRDVQRRADAKAEELRSYILTIYSSWDYRVGKRFGLAPPPIQEKDPDEQPHRSGFIASLAAD